jgi:Sigma-70, region 4
MTTLKEFEEALREQGMNMALAVLERLRQRDRAVRSAAPPRRVRGTKMTPELARRVLELHRTTELTQQEIAFRLGVNQGRVNEVIKRGKWLTDDPNAPEALARDKAVARAGKAARPASAGHRSQRGGPAARKPTAPQQAQLTLGDL